MSVSNAEVIVPTGYFKVDPSIIPRGMGSYLKSMMKQNASRQEYGAVVNAQSITCIIENGQLICAKENTCFMVKVKDEGHDPMEEMKREIHALKTGIVGIGELEKSLFTDDIEVNDIPQPLPIEDPSHIDFDLNIFTEEGKFESTKYLEEIPLCEEISSGYAEPFVSDFWENYIPADHERRLYNFIGRVKTGTQIHIVIAGDPSIQLAFGQADSNLNAGKSITETGVFIKRSDKFIRSQDFALPGNYGLLLRLFMPPYYLLYWVFLLIERNLGYKFDSTHVIGPDTTGFIKVT